MIRIASVGDGNIDVYKSLGKCYAGGNAVNVAVDLKRLGVESSFIGAIGTDDYGKLILETLKNEGVDSSHVQIIPGVTANTQVEFNGNDRVLGDYEEGVMGIYKLNDSDIAFLSDFDLVHSAIWGCVHTDLHKVRENGTEVSFDFADKLEGNEITDYMIKNCDYAIFSYEKDDEYIREYLKKMHEFGPKITLATLGANGSICYDGNEYITCGVEEVKVVDTMGAGDSYIAGFISGIALGLDIKDAMIRGTKSAKRTLEIFGGF